MIKNSTMLEKKEYKTPKVRFAEVQPRKALLVISNGENPFEGDEEEEDI